MAESSMQTWTISNLAHVPHFADSVADRGWNAWWTESEFSLRKYRAGLEPMLRGENIPLAFVAHRGQTYLGSVLLIENDLAQRANLSPWIAALWVDVEHRGQGIAESLMASVRTAAASLGIDKIYLCAEARISPYYLTRGWRQFEMDVDELAVFEMQTSSPR
jgi:predicted N-acetyltransferase YhbS